MRLLSTLIAASLLPGLLAAQDGAGQQPSAQAIYDHLTADLRKQNTAYREARKAVVSSDAYKLAVKNRDSQARRKLLTALKSPDALGLAKRAVAAAQQADGDGRVKLLGWAAVHGRDADLVEAVIAQLTRDHLDSPALTGLLENASVISRSIGREAGGQFLRDVLAKSTHKLPRAWAMYWQSVSLVRGRGVSSDDRRQSARLLRDAEQLAEGTWLADKIRGPRFKAERLQIGMVAPNIRGEDLDGVTFELEDYRGKVVVLDFWGFW